MVTKYGFTTVVDTASLLANTKALRRRIESGEVSGPRILTAGFAIYPPDGVPYYVRDEVPAELLRLLPTPASAAAARAVVTQQLDDGANLVKLFVGSWVARGKVLPMPADIAAAAAGEAHARKLPVLAHPSNLAGLEVALSAGVDVLAHAIEDTRGMTDAHYARMKSQNMAMIPTLYLFRDRWMWDVLDEVRTIRAPGRADPLRHRRRLPAELRSRHRVRPDGSRGPGMARDSRLAHRESRRSASAKARREAASRPASMPIWWCSDRIRRMACAISRMCATPFAAAG